MATRLVGIFFQPEFVKKLGLEIFKVYPEFEHKNFLNLIYTPEWQTLVLKKRMRHITFALGKTLPKDYKKAVEILLSVEAEFSGFDHMVFSDYVEEFGLDDFEISMPALAVFTRSSAEFAIRPFLIKYPDKTFEQLLTWSQSKNEHHRRLASEGSRPRLPWAMGVPYLKTTPELILPILENLKTDSSEYVRRSVANNLNDISKDHPDLVLNLAQRWLSDYPETEKLLRHALRGLLKKGNQRALKLFGYSKLNNVFVSDLEIPKKVKIGSSVKFSGEVTNKAKIPQKLRLEYEMGFLNKSGGESVKVFQIGNYQLGSGDGKRFERKLNFVDKTTRVHYPGKHRLTIVINGHRSETVYFELI